MPDKETEGWINTPKRREILLIFAVPKTLKQAQIELSVRKLTLKSFLRNNCLLCLNPDLRKGRFYVLTEKARKYLNPNCPDCDIHKDWDCIGWIVASPRMRLAVLRCIDNRKLYSEEIRMRATQFNSRLSRPWVKTTLKQLVERNLANSELIERIRFYWITAYGQKIKDELAVLAPLSPLFSLS